MISEIDKRYFLISTPSQDIGYIHNSDIAKSCNICNEGKSYGRKQRLHLYIKTSYDNASISCFNCGYGGNMYSYLKEYYPTEYEMYKRENQGNSFKELKLEDLNTKKEETFDIDDFTNIKIDNFMNSIPDTPTKKDKKTLDVEDNQNEENNPDTDIGPMNLDFGSVMAPMSVPSELLIKEEDPNKPKMIDLDKFKSMFSSLPNNVKQYITDRGLEVNDNWVYSGFNNIITFNNKSIRLSEFIVIPLTLDNKLYGFQALGWNVKKFFVYLIDGNTSWKVWNWDNINKEEPVYIFESIYDAMSSGLDNVIAALGSSLHEDRIKELKKPVFCLDNFRVDEKAHTQLLMYAEKSYEVFVWPLGSESFKDTNDLRKRKVPYEKIKNMILTNIDSGMTAVLKLKIA